MSNECISLDFLHSDDASIVEHGVQEIDPIFSGNGALPRQLLTWFSTNLVRFVADFHVCNEVVCLDLKPAYGSICWIPDWRMDVFKRCCRQIQKGWC